MSIKLLIDSDAFCKLGVAGLIKEAASVFGADLPDCATLPALPYMLRRGRLRDRYGAAICDSLLSTAQAMQVVPDATEATLEQFVGITAIDPGDALLLAVAIEGHLPLITGDKRALVAASSAGIGQTVDGLVAPLEQVLLELCGTFGIPLVSSRCAVLGSVDGMAKICFSNRSVDPVPCLESYLGALEGEISPTRLRARQWKGSK